MEQTMDDSLVNLLKRVKEETGKDIWLWSGYIYENIINDEKKRRILQQVDVLIDGRFQLENRDIKLKYRGSSNQRVIDVKKTLETGEISLIIKNE